VILPIDLKALDFLHSIFLYLWQNIFLSIHVLVDLVETRPEQNTALLCKLQPAVNADLADCIKEITSFWR